MRFTTPKDLSKKYNVTYPTINYYIKVGLLDVIERKGNTRYLNKQSSEDMMKRVVWLKQKGFPLSMINKVMRG